MVDWDDVIKTLGSTAVIIAALGFLAQNMFKQLLKRDIETHKDELKRETDSALMERKSEFDRQMEAFKIELATQTALADRIREEVARWANPILDSVRQLQGRLKNILFDDGYLGLSPSASEHINPEWSVTYEYFLPSTIYLFCQYFCWIRLFEEKMSFELFTEHKEKDDFRDKVRAVSQTLGSFPLRALEGLGGAGDRQVFGLQQRAMGEALAGPQDAAPRCMRYSEFVEKWGDPAFSRLFDPLVNFIDKLDKQNTLRWRRLELMNRALDSLRLECERLLVAETAQR
jgi:hypothetical protein